MPHLKRDEIYMPTLAYKIKHSISIMPHLNKEEKYI
jgi:hypothetical protein